MNPNLRCNCDCKWCLLGPWRQVGNVTHEPWVWTGHDIPVRFLHERQKKNEEERGISRQPVFCGVSCTRAIQDVQIRKSSHSLLWSIRFILYSSLSAEWCFYPLQTNYIRETQAKIFCRAHFSHCPCQWTSNCLVIWDFLFYSVYPFWNNLKSQLRQKAYSRAKLRRLLLKQSSQPSAWHHDSLSKIPQKCSQDILAKELHNIYRVPTVYWIICNKNRIKSLTLEGCFPRGLNQVLEAFQVPALGEAEWWVSLKVLPHNSFPHGLASFPRSSPTCPNVTTVSGLIPDLYPQHIILLGLFFFPTKY